MIVDWSQWFWLGSLYGVANPVFVWSSNASGGVVAAQLPHTQQFVGEIQQLGFGSVMDASTGMNGIS